MTGLNPCRECGSTDIKKVMTNSHCGILCDNCGWGVVLENKGRFLEEVLVKMWNDWTKEDNNDN